MPTSASGPVLNTFHAILPVPASSAASQPRTPNSPPALPTSTLPFTTSGAMVMLSPLLMSPSLVFHSSFPEFASTAMVLPSSVLMMTLPCQYTAPRLTTSQQATPCAAATGCGSYFHFTGAPGLDRSSAYRTFGHGVTMYIVSPTTIGAASCPRSTPVEKVNSTLSLLAFAPWI